MGRQKKINNEREQTSDIEWKPDFFKIEVSSSSKDDLSLLLEHKLKIVPSLILSEMTGGKTTKNNQEYFFYKTIGMDYKKLTQRKAQIEYHSSYFINNDLNKILRKIEEMNKHALIVQILRIDLKADIRGVTPADLYKKRSQIKLKGCFIRRWPLDETKPLESLYIIENNYRWQIKIYDKTKESIKKFKTFNAEKQAEIIRQQFREIQTTRIELKISKELIRTTYLFAIELVDINGIISHFFMRKKFTGPLKKYLKGGKTKYKRDQKIKPFKQTEVSKNSLEKTILLMSLNMSNKALKELNELISDKELIKRVKKNRELILEENKKYIELQDEIFGEK